MNWYEILPKLLNMTLTASVIIAAVMLLRLALRKAPRVYSYLLWAVVLVRLLCPVSIQSPASLLNLLDAPMTETGSIEYVPENIVHTAYPTVYLPTQTLATAINETLPQGEEQLRADPLEAPVSIATYVWMLGMATLMIYSIVQLASLRVRLVGAVEIEPRVYLADHIDTPFVFGVFRPKIYLPSVLTEQERAYVLLHERYHIKRLDHIVKLVAFAALCVHWFNPLVWIAFTLFGKDMEMSCDEAVMKRMGGDIRAAYSASLLRFATGKRIIAGAPLAFGEGDTKDRVKHVMKYKKPAVWIAAIAAVVCVIAGVCFLTNPVEAAEPDDTDVAGTTYSVVEIVYEAPMYSFALTLDNAPVYMVSDTMQLLSEEIAQLSSGETVDGWIPRGDLVETELTKETFDDLFIESSYPLWDGSLAKELRRDNTQAWKVIEQDSPNNVFYYLLEQENGDIYLTYGYLDPEGETDPASDDSHIRWLMKLAHMDAAPTQTGGDDTNVDTPDDRIYTYHDSPEPVGGPTLMLSTDDRRFQFIYSLFSSYIADGTYEIADTQLILRTDDSFENVYVFDIVGDTYVFNASLSSRIPSYRYSADGDSQCPVPDGAVFTTDSPVDTVDAEPTDDPLPTEEPADPIAITNYYDRIPMPIDETYDPFDAAISEAILARYQPEEPDGLIHVESHTILANAVACGVEPVGSEEQGVSEEMLYMIVMYKTYSAYDGELEEVGGTIIPTYLRFSIKEHGQYTLLEYWEPRAGAYYDDDIRKKFGISSGDALDEQQYVAMLDAQCREKALKIMQHAGSLEEHIASLLDEICSSPATASNPGAYIEAHEVAYTELVDYDMYTLRYCFSAFLQGGQTDLRGHIMASACKDVMAKWGETMSVASTPQSTGQDWFEAFRVYARNLLNEHDAAYLEKYYPGACLLVELMGE